MKIAIIGTHSTGKTTLVNELGKELNDHVVIPELARVFQVERILPEKRTIDLQHDMQITHLIIEDCHEKFVSDRSILDYAIYSQNEKFIRQTLRIMKGRYTHLFYIPIKFEVKPDGFRNTDEEYRNHIDNLFRKYAPVGTKEIISYTLKDRIHEVKCYLEG